MTCAWNELLSVLPPGIRSEVNRLGKESAQEIRLRLNGPPELILKENRVFLNGTVTAQDLTYVINTASRYSPWAASSTAKGYLTAPGGHRIGLCGQAVMKGGAMEGIRTPTSLCIRIARDIPGVSNGLINPTGSILIIGAPGWGKTTLLRDLVRRISQWETVSVVDEREELFPTGFSPGKRTDVLTGCHKAFGMEQVLRTMGPSYIAVDEITAEKDCDALIQCASCGVHFLAAIHGTSVSDVRKKTFCSQLFHSKIFDTFLVLSQDKSYRVERTDI